MDITAEYKTQIINSNFDPEFFREKLINSGKYKRGGRTSKLHWAKIRKDVLKRDDYKCVLCGSGLNLQIHHLHYKNLLNEKIEDLQTLCHHCHIKIHQNNKINR